MQAASLNLTVKLLWQPRVKATCVPGLSQYMHKWLSETRGGADRGDASRKWRSVSGTITRGGKYKLDHGSHWREAILGEVFLEAQCGWQLENKFQTMLKLVRVVAVPLDLASFASRLSSGV